MRRHLIVSLSFAIFFYTNHIYQHRYRIYYHLISAPRLMGYVNRN